MTVSLPGAHTEAVKAALKVHWRSFGMVDAKETQARTIAMRRAIAAYLLAKAAEEEREFGETPLFHWLGAQAAELLASLERRGG